jgi:large subunit ribosomal protein L16
MLQPKRTKYRKVQKGKMKGNSGRGHELSNGMFGIKSVHEDGILTRQIEAARIAATRFMKRGTIMDQNIPDKPITKKPLRYVWVKVKVQLSINAVVKPGRICLKLRSSLSVVKEALRLAAQKLPVKTKFVVARDFEAIYILYYETIRNKDLSAAELQESLDSRKHM